MTLTICVRHDGWAHDGDTLVKGAAFHEGTYYDTPALAQLIESTPVNDIHQLLSKLNGFYAVITERGETTIAATDRIRSIPLFYATEADRTFVSDDANWILSQLADPQPDPIAETEFLLLGLVTGSDTRYSALKQVQAAELVRFTGARVTTGRYFRFNHTDTFGAEVALQDEFEDALVGAFDRLTTVAAGRQIAVSLSAGVDSRLVVCMLQLVGYDNVVTFSYGRRENHESRLSERVATELGLPWFFVEYTPEQWREWYADSELREYLHETHNLCVEPDIAAWPAIRALLRDGIIAPDALVVTGDGIMTTGQMLANETHDLGTGAFLSEDAIAGKLVDSQYQLWSWDDPVLFDRLAERMRGRLGKLETDPLGTPAAHIFEEWHWQEVQAKLNTGAAEFAHFGLDWWFPLFDAEVMAFWRRLPLEARLNKAIHTAFVEQLFTDLTGVTLAESTGSRFVQQAKKTLVRASRSTPVSPLLSRVTTARAYTHDPLAIYAIVPRPVYKALSHNAANIHSYVVLDLLGRLPTEAVGQNSKKTPTIEETIQLAHAAPADD